MLCNCASAVPPVDGALFVCLTGSCLLLSHLSSGLKPLSPANGKYKSKPRRFMPRISQLEDVVGGRVLA